MSAHPAAPAHRAHPAQNSISVLFVVLSATLAGLGLLSVLLWVITFQWVWFLGLVPMTLGALLWFSPRAGSNQAEPEV